MTTRIRQAICEKFKHIKHTYNVYEQLEVPVRRQQNGVPSLQWTPSESVFKQQGNNLLSVLKTFGNDDNSCVKRVHLVPAAGKQAARIEFELHADTFAKHILKPEATPSTIAAQSRQTERVLVEFSSPNIAKPFHVGHLRSTIIGNVIANLHQHLGYDTLKINYLGDWGTQFGLLAIGVQLANISDKQMSENPIETLYNAYVIGNKAAEQDPTIATRAREIFRKLEAGDDSDMAQQWQQYRRYTIDELSSVYARLGVQFDRYEWESQYSQGEISAVLERLRFAGLLLREHDGREIVQVGPRRVPVIKSDGSTLYLARDIAALLERHERFKFSRIIYVVDNSQTDHFKALFTTTEALQRNLCNDEKEMLTHVKFGRIHGMSTRQGSTVFLRDVLDEARELMREKRRSSATTKTNVTLDDDRVCDILGISAVIINDLKQRRQRDYEFNWQQALQMNGDTGIKLQYTHCRLHSLLTNFAHISLDNVEPSWQLLAEPEAQDLIYDIARFEQSVLAANQQLESCVLVNYLFGLCNSTSRALKRLPIKQEASMAKQAQRLLLFQAAKRTLHQGMSILGLQPLDQM